MGSSGVSIGRFYEQQYMADPHFNVINLPPRIGGQWNGRMAGLQRGINASTIRNYIAFSSTLPEDEHWEDQNLIVPGGRGVAAHLAAALSSMSVSRSEPEQHSFYGWAFDASLQTVRVLCLLQGGKP